MSRSIRDLTGQRFGRLTVLRPTEERIRGQVVWECECICGNIVFVPSAYLTVGDTASCGCLRKEHATELGQENRENMQGRRFGRLTAIRVLGVNPHRKIVWECKCDCGQSVAVMAHNLQAGRTRSCGCLKTKRSPKDLTGQRFGKLVALRLSDESKPGKVLWECRCDCGKEALVLSANLVTGRSRTCGCSRKEQLGKISMKDLTGQQFGNLTAIRPTQERKQKFIVWECKCNCGKSVLASSQELMLGRVSSCGCKGNEV